MFLIFFGYGKVLEVLCLFSYIYNVYSILGCMMFTCWCNQAMLTLYKRVCNQYNIRIYDVCRLVLIGTEYVILLQMANEHLSNLPVMG